MSTYLFRLADMMPKTWLHKFKHDSNRTRRDPTPVYGKGSASQSLHQHHSSRSRLMTPNLNSLRRCYTGRLGRRRAIYRSSISPGQRVASSSNWGGYCPSPTSGVLISHVDGTEASTDKADFIPTEMDSGRESVDIEYMDAEGGLSYSSDSFSENFSSSGTLLVIELEDQHSSTMSAPNVPTLSSCPKHTTGVKISNKECCQIKNTISWGSSHENYGARFGHKSPVARRRRKSQTCNQKRLSSSSPRASPVIVRFTNKNLGESLAKVRSSYNPKMDFMESITEMIMENQVQSAKDLEDLVSSYLSLNSTHHHQDIIDAFEQIWVKLPFLFL